jgi:hypothetical protein
MNNIPQESQASLLKGYWFIFKDGDRSIAAHGSTLTGQERIFVNGQLVSKKRSLRMTSKHHFNWEESVYDVTFCMPGLFAGKLDCSLTKDEILIGRFKTTFKSKFTISKILIYALAGAVIGFIFGYFNISLWLLPILCICIFVAVAMRGDNNVVINQEV